MTIGRAVALRITELYEAKGWTLNYLATEAGVTQSTLDNIERGISGNPTIGTIKKVCDGLRISIVDFFNTDLFLNLEQEIK